MLIEENRILSPFTTFKIGGPARFFATITSLKDLETILSLQNKTSLPIFILGGGSNLLIKDEGVEGIVIKPNFDFINIKEVNGEIFAEIGAGKNVSEVVWELCKLGYKGFEWLGGLPGTIGGAIRGNAGCFGYEIKDILIDVTVFDLNKKELSVIPNKNCKFSYRHSIFKELPNLLIVEGRFKLENGNAQDLLKTMEEKINYRKEHHPIEFPNAGSIFKNVPIEKVPYELKELAKKRNVIKNDPFPLIPTAFIIDECGLKGKKIGGAKISEKHPNFIINFNNAKAKDVLDLIFLVKEEVYKKFEIELEEEIQIFG